MSHTLNLEVQITCIESLIKACGRVGAKMLNGASHRLYEGTYKGVAVQLPGWRYPVVVNNEGVVQYDNFNGNWGNLSELHRLTDYYGLEFAKSEAESLGHYCYETTDADGYPQLVVQIQEEG